MGNAASRVYGFVVRRPLQRYNVDSRAEKVVKKIEDPTAPAMRAPMYQSDAELLEELRKTNPGMAENAVKKDADLYSRLKDVYVESTDPDQANVGDMRREQPGKPFPKDTSQYSYDFVPAQIRQDMPDRGQRIVSKGKVTLQQAVDILAKHKETEGDFGAEEIVKQYGTNSAATTGMLQHFFIFGMFETNTRKHESVTPDPLISQADWVDKVKSEVGKDPFRLHKEQVDAALGQLENQKNRAAKERERIRLEAPEKSSSPEEEERPKR